MQLLKKKKNMVYSLWSIVYGRNKGFTLVELMLTISVLSVGIVFILRSFLSVISAVDYSDNRIEAIQFLESKAAELEETAEKGGAFSDEEGEVMLGGRKGHWNLTVTSLPLPGEEDKLTIKEIRKADLSISWQESKKRIEESLVTYFLPPKEEEQSEE